MPWKQTTHMEQKNQFVSLAATGRFSFTQLCLDYEISRKTGYKWWRRFRADGRAGLQPRSHRTRSCPHQTAARNERLILRLRRQHPQWGPKKLRDLLQKEHRIKRPPACSTIAGILRRHGASQRSRRKPGSYPVTPSTLTEPTHPNHVWTVDFKGWLTLGNGVRCDPLTVCDLYCRYYLGCKAQHSQQFAETLRTFKKLMRHHGLPKIIRVDNGPPFASFALGRLSALSVWWIRQGIQVEFMRPASPYQNGSHERSHRDLKAETATPPAPNRSAQQKRFDRWRRLRNHVRPHEALQMRRPAEIYRRSPRRLNEKDNPIRYPKDFLVKHATGNGQLLHEGHRYHLGEIYAGCPMGLHRLKDGRTALYFANLQLGYLHFDPAEQFRPKASIAPPDRKPLAKSKLKPKAKV
jgi:transposase InsO family protein